MKKKKIISPAWKLCCHSSAYLAFSVMIPDSTSTGPLFFEYVRIRDTLRSKAETEGRMFWWLFENTSNMDLCTKADMSMYVLYSQGCVLISTRENLM